MTTKQWPDLSALPGVSAAVEQARTAITRVAAHPANRQGWPRSAAAAAVRGARASSALDGGEATADPQLGNVRDPVLAGAIRAVSAVPNLVTVWERAPLQALARLHTLAAADLVPAESLGRPRLTSEHQPASGASQGQRLTGLAAVALNAPWPAPVLVAVVHGELLALRPFGSADGVVARAAARLVMISTGLDRHGLSVPEVGHLRIGAEYQRVADGYADGTTDGVTAWILHVCEALTVGAREAWFIAEASG